MDFLWTGYFYETLLPSNFCIVCRKNIWIPKKVYMAANVCRGWVIKNRLPVKRAVDIVFGHAYNGFMEIILVHNGRLCHPFLRGE